MNPYILLNDPHSFYSRMSGEGQGATDKGLKIEGLAVSKGQIRLDTG